MENGQILYEVEITVNGHSKDVSIITDGSIVEVEEQFALDLLSAEVQAGLKAKASTGKITKSRVPRQKGEAGRLRSKGRNERKGIYSPAVGLVTRDGVACGRPAHWFSGMRNRSRPAASVSARANRNTSKLVFGADVQASALRSTAKHEGSTTLPEALPRASPDQLPHDWHLELRCPHWLEQGHLNWEGPNYLHSAP
jgi:hypothetical protein